MITGVDGVLCPPGMAIRLVERHRFSGRCTARRRRLAQPLRAARRVRLSQVNLSGGNDPKSPRRMHEKTWPSYVLWELEGLCPLVSVHLEHGAKLLEQLWAQPVYDRPALAALF